MTSVEDVLSHFGVKGMHWGLRKSNGSVSVGSSRKAKNLTRKIAVNESIAKSARSRAKLHEKDLNDLQKNGVKSAPMQKRFGRDLIENDFVFATVHGTSKRNALAEMVSAATNNFNTETAIANRAEKRANKLKEKKASLGHDDADDVDDDDELVDDFLQHFGVKGMHWGARRAQAKRASSSDDANSASDAHSKAKKAGGTHALTNKELQDLVTRMNLEKQFNTLKPTSKSKVAVKFVADVLISAGKQQATKLAQEQLAKQIGTLLKK